MFRNVQIAFDNITLPETTRSRDSEADIREAERYKVERFLKTLDLAEAPLQDIESGFPDASYPSAELIETPELESYEAFILNSSAFNWLRTTLLTELQLTRQRANTMQDIQKQILGALPSEYMVSRKKPSEEHKANFKINWDPISFFRDQQYPERLGEAFQHSLTITGSPEDAQCLTTIQYMSQTWPTNGPKLVQLVAQAIQSPDHRASGKW